MCHGLCADLSSLSRFQGKIVNPLAHLSKSQLLSQVEAFAAEKGLESDVDLLKRGALVAQNPADFENIDELSREEKDALQHEVLHKWSHPFLLYLTIFLCSVGAATQGWDQTGVSGCGIRFDATSTR